MNDATVARWRELSALLDQALELDAEARTAWLARLDISAEQRSGLERAIAAAESPGLLERTRSALRGCEAASWIGRQIGAYRIERLLGEGGSASVFLAARDQAGATQHVALKLLRHGLYSDEERARFDRERRLLARLEHPHIARLIDGGLTDAGVPYIVMEYVDGAPLDAWCDAHHLDVRARIALMIQACTAVAHAQRSLIVHRDLKPSNILVARDGALKLLDFGIAKPLGDATLTAADFVRLTPNYAAPEQFSGGAITTATDVYALGVLLYKLLLGRLPQVADGAPLTPSRTTTTEEVAVARATSPRMLARTLRGDLDTILLTALDADPARRYADAASLGADLRRWLDGQPIAARPATVSYRVRKFVQRHRGGVAITALFLLVLFAALGTALWQARAARREAQRAGAVRDFLIGVFDAAQANLPSNEQPTPQALLAEAVRRVRADTVLTPDLRADFLGVAGKVGVSLNDYAQAEALLDEAQQLFDAAGTPADAPERIAALAARSELLQNTNRNAQADALLGASLAQWRRQESPEAVRALMQYAATRLAADYADDAIALAREAAAMAQRVLPPGTREAFAAAAFPGQVLAGAGHNSDAIAALEPVVARWRSSGVALDLAFAQTLNDLAVAKDQSGDSAGANPLYEESIALRRRIFGARPNDRLAAALESYANVLSRHDRLDEAQKLLEEALAIDRQVLGPDNLKVASILDSLGWLQTYRWRLDEAERLIRESFSIYQAHVGTAGHADDLRIVRQHLVQVLLDAQRAEDAAPLNEAALAELHAAGDSSSADYAVARNFQIRIELARGQIAPALAHSEALLTLVDAPAFTYKRLRIIAHRVRASALAAARREAEAVAQIDTAIDLLRASSPDARSAQAMLLIERGRIAQAGGDAQAATSSFAQARALNVPVQQLSPADRATLAAAP